MEMRTFTEDHFAEAAANIPTGELATIPSRLGGLSFTPYNPDDLVRSKSQGIKIYQEMIRDSHVKAALMQKKAKLLKIGWDIIPASDDPLHMEQASYVKWNLQTRLAGAFNRDLFEMLDALDCGFSISEKVFEIVDSGKWQGKAAYKNIKSKDPAFYDFKTDEYGNLEKDGLLLRNGSTDPGKGLPPEKFIIFSYLMRYENFYGSSDLRAAYRPYWLKDTAWKLRAIYMERFAGNNLKGKYPKNDNEAKEKLLEIFRSWQQETGIAIPEGVEIDVLNLATSSKSEYESTIEDCNKEIQVAILGQILTMDTGERGNGSRALGQVHGSVRDDIVWFLDEVLTTDVNLQVVRPLVDLNWDTDEYPVWRFKSRDGDGFDEEKYSRALLNLSRIKGLKIPVKYVKDRMRIPEPEENEAVIEGLEPVNAVRASGRQNSAAAVSLENEKPVKMAESGDPELVEGPNLRPYNKFELFAELPRIDQETEALVKESKEASVPIYDDIRNDILKLVEKKQVLENQDYEAVASIIIDAGELKSHFTGTMLEANLMGLADIAKTADKKPVKMAEDDQYLEDEELVGLAASAGLSEEAYKKLIKEIDDRAFGVAGLEKASIEMKVKQTLFSTLENGGDFKAFNHALKEEFITYSLPVYGGIGAVDDTILDFHAETVFRNTVMNEYNTGRFNQMNDPDVLEAFPAAFLSSVLDGRERETHGRADGLTFMVEDPIWQRLRPPNGHNCREVMIPISALEFTRDMLSLPGDIPKGYPDAGFGG